MPSDIPPAAEPERCCGKPAGALCVHDVSQSASPSMHPDVIHRAELPIDDRPHGIDLTGEILHAAVRRPGKVDVWYVARPDGMQPMRRSFQIVGTGQPIPAYLSRHHATAITPDGALVWHVLENHCPHQDVVETTEWGQLRKNGSGLCPHCPVRLRGDGDGGWIPT